MAKAGASAPYARLTVGQKQRRHRDGMREPAVRCPACETQTTVADLLMHIEMRCPGASSPEPPPHPRSRWVTWREALELGVPRGTMNRWIGRGLVRTRTVPIPQRQYLLRDLVTRIADRRARRR